MVVRTGFPKLGWLNTSNISLRNCRVNRSVILVTEKSVFRKLRPVMESRHKLLGCQVGSVAGGAAATQGATKTVRLANHCEGLQLPGSPHSPRVSW